METAIVFETVLGVATALWVLAYAWQRRELNRPAAAAARYPSFGLANTLTLTRGLLLVPLAAALVVPRPQSALPGLAYLLAILLDFLDGLAARLTRRESLLGKALDLHYDALGVLLATALLVRLGKVPLPYLLTGLARPLFVLGEGFLRRLGREPQPLQPKALRRTLAGLQMGFLAAALQPVFPAEVTQGFAWLFFLPFAANFLLDFLQVAGWPLPTAFGLPGRWKIVLRAATGLAALWIVPTAWPLAVMLTFGILPRLSAAALTLLTAILQTVHQTAAGWGLAALAVWLLHFGGGPGLWSPDERLFTGKLGE